MATIDELVVSIRADASSLERALRRAQGVTEQSARRMGGAVTSLAGQFRALLPALGVGAFAAYAKGVVAAAGAMQDLADRTGVSAGFLSGLKVEVENAGGSVEGLAQAVFLMNNAIGEAAKDAGGPVAESFRKLGLDLEALKQQSPEQQFVSIAQAISRLGTDFEQTEAARNIFGRGVAGILPLLKQGEEGIRKVTEAARESGTALGGDTIAAVDQFGDAMNRLATAIGNNVVNAFAEALIAAQRFFGSTKAMSTEAIAREIASAEAALAASNATPAGMQTRDRLGNVIDKSAGLQSRLDELRAAYNADQRSPYGPLPKPTPAQATQAKAANRGESEANAILAERTRIIQANRTAQEVFNDRMANASRLLKDSGEDQIQLYREQKAAYEEYADAVATGTQKAKDSTEELAVSIRSSLANSFESALFDAKNFGDGLTGILDGIARQIARKALIDPLSSGLTDLIGQQTGGFSFGKLLGFADGGSPPVGVPSVVGERGPELFVPRSAGTVVPNHALGGSSTSVTHVWQIQGGVTKQEMAELIPVIERRSTAATLAAIERGGAASRAVNRRQ